MPDFAALAAFVRAAHDPALAEQEGMVHMVFQDFEIASQKSGPLLWHRTLHTLVPGRTDIGAGFPMPMTLNEHTYAFVSDEVVRVVTLALKGGGTPPPAPP